MRSITLNPGVLITGILLTLLLVLALMFTGQMSANSSDMENNAATLYLDLDQRLEQLEAEIALLKDSLANGGDAPSQDDVVRVLNDLSDRWMRNISGSLTEIHRDLDNINKTIAGK